MCAKVNVIVIYTILYRMILWFWCAFEHVCVVPSDFFAYCLFLMLGSGQAKTIAIQPPMWFSKGEATPNIWLGKWFLRFLPRWISSHQWSRSWSNEALEITGKEIWNGTPILHVSLVFISLDLGWSRYTSQFCCVFFVFCVAWWFLYPCALIQIYLHLFVSICTDFLQIPNSKPTPCGISLAFGGSYFLEWSAACFIRTWVCQQTLRKKRCFFVESLNHVKIKSMHGLLRGFEFWAPDWQRSKYGTCHFRMGSIHIFSGVRGRRKHNGGFGTSPCSRQR